MLGSSCRVRLCLRSSRSATADRSTRYGTGRSRSSTTPPSRRRVRLSRLPLIQLSRRGRYIPGHPSVAGAHCSLDALELAVGLARSGLRLRGRHRSGRQGAALRDRLRASRADRIRRRALRRFRREQRRDDARRADASRTVPVTTHLPLRDVPGTAHVGAHRIARHGRRCAGFSATSASPSRDSPISGLNPHAGEGGSARPRGDRRHRAGDRGACARRAGE